MKREKKRKKLDVNQIVISCFLTLVVATLVFLGIKTMRESKIVSVNRAIDEGREAYLSADYRKAINSFVLATDSLKFESDEAELNIAHSLFNLSGSGTSKESESVNDVIKNTPASEREKKGRGDLDAYTTIVGTTDRKLIASVAYNQVGVINYRSAKDQVSDTTLENAMVYFKAALEKDPENEIARYNYELLKKKIEYPDRIMRRVRALVKENRYVEAHNVMEAAAKKDPRIEQRNQGFLNRLKEIIKIDMQ